MNLSNFCVAPWLHLHSLANGEILPCCYADTTDIVFPNINNDIKKIWNSLPYKKIRKNILKGRKNKSCNHCYEQEALGNVSNRQNLNNKWLDVEMENHIISNTDIDGTCKEINIKNIDIRFSNKCNFKCRMCGIISSNRCIDYYSNYKKEVNIICLNNVSEWFSKNLEYLKKLEYIYIAGGEPLITDQHYEFLECLIKYKIFPSIYYQTNGSVLKYKHWDIFKLWDNFDIKYGLSVDGIGSMGEYIRTGYKQSQIDKNMKEVFKYFKIDNIVINIACSVYNVYFITELFDKLYQKGWTKSENFLLQLVTSPELLQPNVLSYELKCQSIDKILSSKWFKKYPDKFTSVLNNLKTEANNENISKFKKYTKDLDIINKTSIVDYFPQINEYLKK